MTTNGFNIGDRVSFLTWEDVGTVVEFGSRASTLRGIEYRAARVEWSGGRSDWLSSLDLILREAE